MDNNIFPDLRKSLNDLIEDEEGNIPGNKLLMIGTLVLVMSQLLSIDALARHSSHVSHSSHSSHVSGSGGYHGSHSSHASHTSHTSASYHESGSEAPAHSSAPVHSSAPHSSHASHTSHSNTAVHSNSAYSAEGDVISNAPNVYNIPPVKQPETTTHLDDLSNVLQKAKEFFGDTGGSLALITEPTPEPDTLLNSQVDVPKTNPVN